MMADNFEEDIRTNGTSDENLFLKIWTSPRKVFRFIDTYQYDKHVTVLLLLAGIARAFNRVTIKDIGDNSSLFTILAISIIGGALIGWIGIYVYSLGISWTGKWLDGKGSANMILSVLAYSAIPSITAMLLLIPQILVLGTNAFSSEVNADSVGTLAYTIGNGSRILANCLHVYSVVLCVIGLSAIQKISILKSIVNLLLPALIIAGPFLIIYLSFKYF